MSNQSKSENQQDQVGQVSRWEAPRNFSRHQQSWPGQHTDLIKKSPFILFSTPIDLKNSIFDLKVNPDITT